MIFTTLALMQVFQAFGTRSQTESLRRIGWRSNPALLAVAALVVALQLVGDLLPAATACSTSSRSPPSIWSCASASAWRC